MQKQSADIVELAAKHRLAGLMKITRVIPIGLGAFFLVVGAGAQVSSPPKPDELKAKCGSQVRSTYLLGPDDQLEISGPELTDLANKPMRIDDDGAIQVPLAGQVHLAGPTVQQTEQKPNKTLLTYIPHPHFFLNVPESPIHTTPSLPP